MNNIYGAGSAVRKFCKNERREAPLKALLLQLQQVESHVLHWQKIIFALSLGHETIQG